MRYIGGKSRIAKHIVEAILQNSSNREVCFEPFMGGGSVTAELSKHFDRVIASDSSEDLMLMWKSVQLGWVPPERISEEEYQILKDAEIPSALRGFTGFGGSFGGKWFAGYARGGKNADGTPRNHQAESARAVARIGKNLGNVDLHRADYQVMLARIQEKSCVIYCDPPYASTQGYSVGDFDSERFWIWMDTLADLGHEVFVSEYAAPEGWTEVWSKRSRQSLVRGDQDRFLTTEKLFTRGGK